VSKQGQITWSSALWLVPLLIMNKYSKFQMDTFDSFWEMDSDKKLNLKLNRPRRWRWRRSDDNNSTFFLWKVELKMWSQKYSRLWCIKDYHPSLQLFLPADDIISTCDHRNTVDLWLIFVCVCDTCAPNVG
jgi:hypothetical protein